MTRYVSPINPAVYPHLSLVLMTMGFFFMAWFFVYPFADECAMVLLSFVCNRHFISAILSFRECSHY